MNRQLLALLILCLPSANLFSQGTSAAFEWTAPKTAPEKSLYKLIAFLDSRQDTSYVGSYSLEPGAKPTRLLLKTPIQPQLEAILNAYTDASSGFGAVLFQLKRFSFAETQKTVYTYLSANLYALKDNGYVLLLNLDTTLVIDGPVNFRPALANASNEVIDNFIARGIVMEPVDTIVYSYDDVRRIDSVRKRKLKVYNTSAYAEGFYSNYTVFKKQTPDLQGAVEVRSDRSLAVTLHSTEWTEPRARNIFLPSSTRAYRISSRILGIIPLEKQADDFYFTGRLNVVGSSQSPFGLFYGQCGESGQTRITACSSTITTGIHSHQGAGSRPAITKWLPVYAATNLDQSFRFEKTNRLRPDDISPSAFSRALLKDRCKCLL